MGRSYHSKLGFKEWKYRNQFLRSLVAKKLGLWGKELGLWLDFYPNAKHREGLIGLTCLSLHTVVSCGPTQISSSTRDSYQSQEQWKKVLCKINTLHILDWGCVLSATWKYTSCPTLSNSLSENLSIGKMAFFPLKLNLEEFLFIISFFSPAVTHSMLLTSIHPLGIKNHYS